MSKKSDVEAEILQNIIESKKVDKEGGLVKSDTTDAYEEMLKLVSDIDSLE